MSPFQITVIFFSISFLKFLKEFNLKVVVEKKKPKKKAIGLKMVHSQKIEIQ